MGGESEREREGSDSACSWPAAALSNFPRCGAVELLDAEADGVGRR